MELGTSPCREGPRPGDRPWPEDAPDDAPDDARDRRPDVLAPTILPLPATSRGRRAFDFLGALVLLAVASPFLLAGALGVWLLAGRPILFAQTRVGLGGRPFRCWKLRTMVPDAEERLRRDEHLRRRHRESGFKLPVDGDPRIVPGAEWLRRSHIDELPQLVNVLLGEMSLVGPRPVVREELACYGDEWRTLVSRRPGLIGAWTAEGTNRPGYPERARLELDYVREAGFRRDVKILFRSLAAPFGRRVRG